MSISRRCRYKRLSFITVTANRFHLATFKVHFVAKNATVGTIASEFATGETHDGKVNLHY